MATEPKYANYSNIVYNTALSEGVTDNPAKVIAAQAGHETGGFASSLFKRSNNCFGMTVPHVRKSSFIIGSAGDQPDGSGKYAKYASIEDSVRDLLGWMRYNKIDVNRLDTIDKYAAAIKAKGYFGDTITNYINGMRSFYNSMIGFFRVSTTGLFVALALSALLFLIFKNKLV